ncbi:uncharacterized protein LOC112048491 [Bicyclus anynana]|uniref:Uncharacterized protein LOC112048491 n=1 Tax=Bicyclus anynana TaxID=110368 RepID=A0A6J1N9P2_BICAN|nr:uncharacterized protein LOC112048491 [Bicyclus anynana]
MAKQNDGLFLLEVLIDKIIFVKSPCFSDKDFRTCINIKSPGVEPMEICDDEPGSCVAKSNGPFIKCFNSGKSCLFSLTENDISSAMSKFPIMVSVYKSLPCGCLPTKINMGECEIDMTKEFVEARKTFLEDPTNVSYQALKDSFRIVGPDNAETGEIIMFLRISCFGKLIVTKFQGPGSPPNLGATKSSAIVDRSCAPNKEFQSMQDPCACGAARGSNRGHSQSCNVKGGGGVCPKARDPYNSMPCEDTDDPCYCSGPKSPAKEKMECRNTDPYCLHVPKGRNKDFEEIGTTLGGNELKIKVPASASVIKKISQTHCLMQYPYTKGSVNNGPCMPPCGKNQISLALPTEMTCCQGAQPAETQFTCTTDGCLQTTKHNQQAAIARGDGKQQTELPNREVFVLKVAKTALINDKKCKFELELVTPKGPDKKPPVRKMNSCLQSDIDCFCYCCPTGNKVVFQIPMDSCDLGHKQRAHFNFSSDGVGDLAREEPGQLLPTSAPDYHGVVYDFPNQVIKMRIGKTIEMPGRKTKLEYQFITPVATYEKIVPVKDNRTAQYTNQPTCTPLMPLNQDLVDEQKKRLVYLTNVKYIQDNFLDNHSNTTQLPILNDDLKVLCCPSEVHTKEHSLNNYVSFTSNTSKLTLMSKKRSLSSLNKSKNFWETCLPIQFNDYISKSGIFGKNQILVYMTLSDRLCRYRTLSTQATASINKCFQVNDWFPRTPNSNVTCTDKSSSCVLSTYYRHEQVIPDKLNSTNVYFFGRKKETNPKAKGMGAKVSHTKLQRTSQTSTHSIKGEQKSSKSSVKSESIESIKKPKSSQATTTAKSVTIKDEKQLKPCPALNATKGDMMVTVSHIKIGPKETCPIHGNEPCQGPKCILASTGEEQGPVKVTTANNPRRGVFEIVIRKLTGAPLAKNELMLEWTPPPSRPPACSGPFPIPCLRPSSCRPPKCKLVVCRPSPCKTKCCKRPCGRPPCKKCCRNPCKPCPPIRCTPCNPCNQCYLCCSSPSCNSPSPKCSRSTCTSPCRSSPCLRPCPVGRKRHRKVRSHPRIKQHLKRISPCNNRSKTCPVVRCRSVPNPCTACCFVPPFCIPRRCCSISRCKPPKICPSTCSS